MNENIIKQLKTLKEITPDSGFVSRTRSLFAPVSISSAPAQKNIISSFAWQYIGAFAVVLILIFSVPFFFFTPEPTLASLDVVSITNEIHKLPINIQLQEIQYDEEVQNTITNAISEASNTDTNHLSYSLLKDEEASIEKIKKIDTSVDDLLNKVIQ